MRILPLSLALALLAIPAWAQAPGPAPDPATLKAAREVVAKMQGDRASTLSSMAAPMVGLIQQMGVREVDRAQVLAQEVVIPTLAERYDDLLDVQARSFASVLAPSDLQAVAAFYDTPAGRNLAAAQPRLAQAQVTGMTQWMTGLAPVLQAKLGQAIQAHGWGPAGAAKPR